MTITTLLPNAEQTFLDENGDPLVGGKVYFYIPQTTIPKSTWQDEDQTVPNTNPVILDAAGRAIIYGAGSYRQLVTDALDNLVWDQETASTNRTQIYVGGQTEGTVNAQTLDVDNYDLISGNLILFTFGLTNTTAMTLDISGTGAVPVTKNSGGVQVPLVAGDAVAGQFGAVFYDGTEYQLISVIGTSLEANPLTSIASAATTDIGSTGSTNVQITGTTTITSLGASANVNQPLYFLKFTGALTLTYNATSLILPGAANVVTAANDTAFALYLGSGNWQVVQFTRAANAIGGGVGAMPGAIGLLIQNNVGTPNTKRDIAADYVVLLNASTLAPQAYSSVSVTIDYTTVGANGLDTGALAANTFYFEYLISNGVTIAGLASLSATTPALPAGYVQVMRVSAVPTDGSANLQALIQKGNRAQYNSAPSMGTGTLTLAGFVPSTATEMSITCNSPNASITTYSNGIYTVQSGFNGVGAETGNFTNMQLIDFLITTATIATSNGFVNCVGWRDKVMAV